MLLPSPQAALPGSFCTTLTDWSFHCLPGPSDTSTSEDYTSALSSNNSEFLGKQKCNTSGWKRRFLNRMLLRLTEIDGIAFCQFLFFYLQRRSPHTVLWERPTATNREQLKLNNPNATLVLNFRLEKTLGWPRNRPESKVQAQSKGAKNLRGPWSSVFKTFWNFLIVILLMMGT